MSVRLTRERIPNERIILKLFYLVYHLCDLHHRYSYRCDNRLYNVLLP
jgi:hypothetical protein